jgi:hypothetical protein
MSLITFVRVAAPAASFEPTHNPDYTGYINSKRRHQPRNLADTGAVYSYKKGTTGRRMLRWSALPTADLLALILFCDELVGAGYTFTFTEHDGTEQTAKVVSKNVPHKYVGGGKHTVELEVEIL